MPYINTAERLGMEKGHQQGLEQGLEQGRLENQRDTARNLIKLGLLSDAQIANATGLNVDEVETLRHAPKH